MSVQILNSLIIQSLTHKHQVDSSTTALWTNLFPTAGCLVSFYYFLCFTVISVFNASSVDPDQMPHSAAFDLSLHCLSIFLLGFGWGAGEGVCGSQLKLVNSISRQMQQISHWRYFPRK